MVSFTSTLLAAFAASAAVIATPVAVSMPEITAPPTPTVVKRAESCTFRGANGAAQASRSQKSCATMVLSGLTVPAGRTLDLSKLADDTHVIFRGKTSFGVKQWAGPLVSIKGRGITVTGENGAVLDGRGESYWDGHGSNGGRKKPKFFAAHGLTDSRIENIHLLNTPVQAVSINRCNGLTITGMTIDNRAGDDGSGHNTDGFDIGDSNDVVITGAKVYNQDDCVAINSGTRITFSGGLCSGGHGLSIGSVGGRSNNVVDQVTFSNSVVRDSTNGIRVKAVAGRTGSISSVTYSDITLQSISKYGILVEQNYNRGDLHGRPTTGVPITDLTLRNINGWGSVANRGHNVVVACGSSSSCRGWNWSGVSVSGGRKYGSCYNVPSVVGGCY